MTDVTTPPPPGHYRPWSAATGWISAKDPGLLAVKRSLRAAVVMPTVFGLSHVLFSSPQVGLFGAFGSFALLLLVDFPGRPRTRLVSFVAFFAVGCGFIALGTAVSTNKAGAVVAMAMVAFIVLFAGIVTPQAATAATASILVFVLPVAVAQPTAAIGPRLIGWGLATALCVPACLLIWPSPWHDDLRRRLSATVSALARLAAGHAEGVFDPGSKEEVAAELAQLRQQFAATPYPPTGAAAGAVALSKLVGRVEWAAGSASALGDTSMAPDMADVRAVIAAVADTLRRCATLICDGSGHPVDDPTLVRALEDSTRRLDELIDAELATEIATLTDPGAGQRQPASGGDGPMPSPGHSGIASTLDPAFRARALAISVLMVADATLETAGAPAVSDVRMGVGDDHPTSVVGRRLISHLSLRSVWFRNAVRGAAGLALAVVVVEVTDVEHGFWVVLGTLSVLRSNALGTGSSALRAIGGTAVGFVVGSAIMVGVASHLALLWVLLPVAVLVSGAAQSMISFAAGQAGFTLVVVILFNIIEPAGWKVGLTRIEDVAIGCAVSVVVGLLFWPRGATAALGRALADGFVTSSGALADAVERLTMTTRQIDIQPSQRASHRAYILLDDAFRQFLAERGAKVVPVETVANLFTGTNRIRLAAYTLGTLPAIGPGVGRSELDSVAIAGAVLRDSYASSHRWYEEFADLLADGRDTLDPPPVHDATLHDVLRRAFDEARARRSDRLRTTLQMLWADELLESQAQVQLDLAASAALFARNRHKQPMI
jgi:hypothetical protein